jgi:hypothetical protein
MFDEMIDKIASRMEHKLEKKNVFYSEKQGIYGKKQRFYIKNRDFIVKNRIL